MRTGENPRAPWGVFQSTLGTHGNDCTACASTITCKQEHAHALLQVVALLLRSNQRVDDGEGTVPPSQEIDYPHVLNRVLPPTIRVLGWADAPQGFNARFSADRRRVQLGGICLGGK